MTRAPCCEKIGLKRGPWTSEEDKILVEYIKQNGHGCWRALPKQAGLLRCVKSCRLRWTNYLRPDVKRGQFQAEEERSILQLHAILGNRWTNYLRPDIKWSTIASQLPGRTDNEIKNFWNTHLKKKLVRMGLDPSTHAPNNDQPTAALRHALQWEIVRVEAEARFSRSNSILSSENKLMENTKEPSDLFLKLWSSEPGKAFRENSDMKRTKSNNSRSEDTINLDNHTSDPQWTFSSDLSCGIARNEKMNSLMMSERKNNNSSVSSDDWEDLLLHDYPNTNTADSTSKTAQLSSSPQLKSDWACQGVCPDEDNDNWDSLVGMCNFSSNEM